MDPRRLRACAGCLRRSSALSLLCLAGCAASSSSGAAPDAAEPAVEVDGARAPDLSHDPAPPDSAPPPADAGADARALETGALPFQPCPATGPCRVLPLGDSLTFGVGSAGAGGGYRVPLFRRALGAKQSLTFVGSQANGPDTVDGVAFPRGHEGYRGYSIEPGGGREGLSTVVAKIVTAAQPHVVLLLAGTNDVGATIIDPPHAPDRLAALIDRVVEAAPAALILVAQIPPSMD